MIEAVASAPGKLVILGEYAVLANAPALVMAVDRRCRAEIRHSVNAVCHLHSMAEAERQVIFRRRARSGLALVDRVAGAFPAAGNDSWRGVLDSSGLYFEGRKLGLGSSAAALTAWCGAWLAWTGQGITEARAGVLQRFIAEHRAWQGGAGSGLDVAASLHGGVIRFQLDEDSGPQVDSAKLPDGVDFVGVFVRTSASTRQHLAQFGTRAAESPASAAFWMDSLNRLAETGIDRAAADDAGGFLAAIRDYAGGLQALGEWMGAAIFTPEHLQVLKLAERFGLAYKVSGAGGGDLGLAFGTDAEALARFRKAADEHYVTIDLAVDPRGLDVKTVNR